MPWLRSLCMLALALPAAIGDSKGYRLRRRTGEDLKDKDSKVESSSIATSSHESPHSTYGDWDKATPSRPLKDTVITTSIVFDSDKDKTVTIPSYIKDNTNATLPDKEKITVTLQVTSNNDKYPTGLPDKDKTQPLSASPTGNTQSSLSAFDKDESLTGLPDKDKTQPLPTPSTGNYTSSLSTFDKDKPYPTISDKDKPESVSLPSKDAKTTPPTSLVNSNVTSSLVPGKDESKVPSFSSLSIGTAVSTTEKGKPIGSSSTLTVQASVGTTVTFSSLVSSRASLGNFPPVITYSITIPLPVTSSMEDGVPPKDKTTSAPYQPSRSIRYPFPPSVLTALTVSKSLGKPEFPGYDIVPSPTETGYKDKHKQIPSVTPVWTPEMLGNAYGGGYITTPSIYVSKRPYPTGPPEGMPPGYGYSSKRESSVIPSNTPSSLIEQETNKTYTFGIPSFSDKPKKDESSSTVALSSPTSLVSSLVVVIGDSSTLRTTIARLPSTNEASTDKDYQNGKDSSNGTPASATTYSFSGPGNSSLFIPQPNNPPESLTTAPAAASSITSVNRITVVKTALSGLGPFTNLSLPTRDVTLTSTLSLAANASVGAALGEAPFQSFTPKDQSFESQDKETKSNELQGANSSINSGLPSNVLESPATGPINSGLTTKDLLTPSAGSLVSPLPTKDVASPAAGSVLSSLHTKDLVSAVAGPIPSALPSKDLVSSAAGTVLSPQPTKGIVSLVAVSTISVLPSKDLVSPAGSFASLLPSKDFVSPATAPINSTLPTKDLVSPTSGLVFSAPPSKDLVSATAGPALPPLDTKDLASLATEQPATTTPSTGQPAISGELNPITDTAESVSPTSDSESVSSNAVLFGTLVVAPAQTPTSQPGGGLINGFNSQNIAVSITQSSVSGQSGQGSNEISSLFSSATSSTNVVALSHSKALESGGTPQSNAASLAAASPIPTNANSPKEVKSGAGAVNALSSSGGTIETPTLGVVLQGASTPTNAAIESVKDRSSGPTSAASNEQKSQTLIQSSANAGAGSPGLDSFASSIPTSSIMAGGSDLASESGLKVSDVSNMGSGVEVQPTNSASNEATPVFTTSAPTFVAGAGPLAASSEAPTSNAVVVTPASEQISGLSALSASRSLNTIVAGGISTSQSSPTSETTGTGISGGHAAGVKFGTPDTGDNNTVVAGLNAGEGSGSPLPFESAVETSGLSEAVDTAPASPTSSAFSAITGFSQAASPLVTALTGSPISASSGKSGNDSVSVLLQPTAPSIFAGGASKSQSRVDISLSVGLLGLALFALI